ncbi:MAG: hypothetical protein MK209_06825 [Planctomycetes bacterium]|nr:hypothetical protein [Planctomycetota bacterium]
MRILTPLAALAGLWSGMVACSSGHRVEEAGFHDVAADSGLAFVQIDQSPVDKLLKLTDELYSGAEPKTDEAYAELARLGVRTIVNVDGATPKLAMAAKYGMEYIHIPIGYDKIAQGEIAAIVCVMRERESSFYFHCHHGRHRGPAAAAIALMELTGCSVEDGIQVLVEAGTSESYPGLWRDVRAFKSPAQGIQLPRLVSVAEVSDFEASMAKLDRTWDEMKIIQKAGFRSTAEHPDLDPHNVARILRESIEISSHMTHPQLAADVLYQEEMQKALDGARALEAALSEDHLVDAQEPFDVVRRSCKACHIEFRDD